MAPATNNVDMAFLKLAFARELQRPMWALLLASLLCVGMVTARALWTHRLSYGFLIWNLFLAWLPLVIALLASVQHQKAGRLEWRLGALALAWLLFFPNAPYICTDIIHLSRFRQHYWVDLVLVLTCALTGLVIGFLSLFLVQSVVARLYGKQWALGGGDSGLPAEWFRHLHWPHPPLQQLGCCGKACSVLTWHRKMGFGSLRKFSNLRVSRVVRRLCASLVPDVLRPHSPASSSGGGSRACPRPNRSPGRSLRFVCWIRLPACPLRNH